jgi:hypothetical protein
VDKVLLLLPLLPLMDLVSTLFSLRFGGEEVGILARPMLHQYGPSALVVLAATASLLFLVFMSVVIRIKGTFVNGWRIRWMWFVLVIPIYWFFVLEGVYVSTVVMNFLVPVAPVLTQGVALRGAFVGVYFAGVSVFTLPKMKELPRFQLRSGPDRG